MLLILCIRYFIFVVTFIISEYPRHLATISLNIVQTLWIMYDLFYFLLKDSLLEDSIFHLIIACGSLVSITICVIGNFVSRKSRHLPGGPLRDIRRPLNKNSHIGA